MEKEPKYGQMVVCTKAIGLMTNVRDWGGLFITLGTHTPANGKKICAMALVESSSEIVAPTMKVIGRMMLNMVWARRFGQMVPFTRENSLMGPKKAKVTLSGKTEAHIVVNSYRIR